jgi:1,4-dihydroxy-2-naphthoate octaprenyltransferase
MIKNFIRALRASFLAASILPFVFGSLIIRKNFNLIGFIFGLLAVTFTHLSANLINDYADSRSGADNSDRHFYPFFGGSKLIQENILSEKYYLHAALFCAAIALLSVVLLAFILKSALVMILYILILLSSWQYSAKPLQFSYHYLGELFIFILFGPVLVMGGYYIQSGIFPELKSFIISLPLGFFIVALLFANEVPDFKDDQRVNKNNWVGLLTLSRAYLIYMGLVFLGLFSVILVVLLRYSGVFSLVSLLLIIPALKAARILRDSYFDKMKLLKSSGITINMQAALSLILILSLII